MAVVSVIDKAHDLGDALANSPELSALQKAEAELAGDPVAKKLWEEHERRRHSWELARRQGQEISEQERNEMAKLEEELAGNQAIQTYVEAQNRWANLIQGVNFILRRAAGQQGFGGCSSCPGACHAREDIEQ